MKIIISGKKNGKYVEVKYLDGKFTFNNSINMIYEKEIKSMLQRRYPVGGTFYPEIKSDLNLINVLENHFFDKCEVAKVDGAKIDEIESVDGRIY